MKQQIVNEHWYASDANMNIDTVLQTEIPDKRVGSVVVTEKNGPNGVEVEIDVKGIDLHSILRPSKSRYGMSIRVIGDQIADIYMHILTVIRNTRLHRTEIENRALQHYGRIRSGAWEFEGASRTFPADSETVLEGDFAAVWRNAGFMGHGIPPSIFHFIEKTNNRTWNLLPQEKHLPAKTQ